MARGQAPKSPRKVATKEVRRRVRRVRAGSRTPPSHCRIRQDSMALKGLRQWPNSAKAGEKGTMLMIRSLDAGLPVALVAALVGSLAVSSASAQQPAAQPSPAAAKPAVAAPKPAVAAPKPESKPESKPEPKPELRPAQTATA